METLASASTVFVYGYDDLGRLETVAKDGSLAEEYSYDDTGNRNYQTSSALGFTSRSFSHSVEDHTLTAGDVTYTFDYDGCQGSRFQDVKNEVSAISHWVSFNRMLLSRKLIRRHLAYNSLSDLFVFKHFQTLTISGNR